ncbi:hypothetical protein [Prosthecomicrobium hirschii]|uniref:hypothetical protein n=1 Tax=Prosthecodimorpha hirschii TaxID=665126 RepID=UPI00221F1F48|nr:hypothetical protein [Prosthecomicrobium hirschii]MCW1839450.1 hypothetical protein [Prosthecomicrobium hirschii]
MDGTIERKGEFARRINVTPARISQLIAEGKLSGAALVGEGREQRVVVAEAIRQIRASRDPSQGYGLNGITTRLDDPPAAQATSAPTPAVPTAPVPVGNTVEDRIKAERLRQAELTTQRLEREDAASKGLYMRASDAAEEAARIAARMLKIFEGALPDFAGAIAGRFALAPRDVLHELRTEFRRVRERASRDEAAAADSEPEFLPAGPERRPDA